MVTSTRTSRSFWRVFAHGPLLSLVLFLAAAGQGVSAQTSKTLSVQKHGQETEWWCWAACGQMVMDFLGHDVSQCRQAKDYFGVSSCPCDACASEDMASDCFDGGWPQFKKYGFSCSKKSAALSWTKLKQELQTRPFVFTWKMADSYTSHMMLAYGWFLDGGIQWLRVIDPLPVCDGDRTLMTYETYDEVPGDHSHWIDFYNVHYVGASGHPSCPGGPSSGTLPTGLQEDDRLADHSVTPAGGSGDGSRNRSWFPPHHGVTSEGHTRSALRGAWADPKLMKRVSDAAYMRDTSGAASATLRSVLAHLEPKDLEDLGFRPTDDVRRFTLGSPLRRFQLGLRAIAGRRSSRGAGSRAPASRSDDTRGGRDSRDSRVRLITSPTLFYPILIGEETRSSIVMDLSRSSPHPSTIGNPRFSKSLAEAVAKLPGKGGAAGSEDFILEVPGLNLQFAGRERDESADLAPIYDYPRFKIERGGILSLDDLLARIQLFTGRASRRR